jgi:hypothetical protein
MRRVCSSLVGNPDGKRPFERPRHRLEDNTKMYLKLLRWGLLAGFIWQIIGTSGRLFRLHERRGIS